jgi:hypothetical protein
MATQTRVPGAASSEVDFELERFERTAEDRIEITGRWYGLRGRRFVRPVLNLNVSGSRRRAIALLEHKPWAADDGKTWLAAFRWPQGAGEIQGAELEVGPGLIVELPAPGGKANTAVRVSALRPHVPTPRGPAFRATEETALREAAGETGDLEPRGGRDAAAESDPGDRGPSLRLGTRDDRAGPRRDGPAPRLHGAPTWTASPPRDVLTTALAERDEALAARNDAERERATALNERDDALSRRDAALRDVERAGGERDEAVAERERLKAELERVTRERDIAHAERNRTLQDAEAVARERDQAAAERDAARSELSRALPAREEAIRDRDAEAARADRAESERDTAFAERKSAVAQRDRARRERDRAMRAVGVEPPEESPYPTPDGVRGPHGGGDADRPAAIADGQAGDGAAPAGAAGDGSRDDGPAGADSADPSPGERAGGRRTAAAWGSVAARSAATPPGTPLPSRPVKKIGTGPLGPSPESKPLLTPVDAGRPRRLSRTRRAPSAPARWAVRIVVLALLVALAIVCIMLLGRVL